MPDADTTYYKNMIASLVDAVWTAESKTSAWNAAADVVATFNGGKVGRIPTLDIAGLKDYNAAQGYEGALVGANYEDVTLQYDRGRKLILDAVKSIADNNGIPTAGRVVGNFVRNSVVPEIDMTRVAAVCGAMTGVAGHIATGYTPAKGTIVTKIAEGLAAVQDDCGVDFCNILVNGKYRALLETSSEIAKTLDVGQGNGTINTRMLEYNGSPVTFCPSSRMVSAVEKKSDGSIGATTAAKEVIAVIEAPGAIQGVVARNVEKIIDASASENFDATTVNFRLYHGCFIPEGAKKAVYVITS